MRIVYRIQILSLATRRWRYVTTKADGKRTFTTRESAEKFVTIHAQPPECAILRIRAEYADELSR